MTELDIEKWMFVGPKIVISTEASCESCMVQVLLKAHVWNIVVLGLWACNGKEHRLHQTHVQIKLS